MTAPWKTWMRERLPSTTRTCTLTVSPGRNWGMSSRNESASSASRVFISAVLSPSSSSKSVQTAEMPGRPNRWLRLRDGAPVGWRRRSAAALYCATSSGDDARGPRPRTSQQLIESGRQLGGDEDLVAAADLRGAPPAVRLVLVRLDLRLPADVDLVDDVPEGVVGLPVVHRNAEQRRDGATQPDRPFQRGGVDDETDLLGQLAGRRLPQRLPRLDLSPGRVPVQDGAGRRREVHQPRAEQEHAALRIQHQHPGGRTDGERVSHPRRGWSARRRTARRGAVRPG